MDFVISATDFKDLYHKHIRILQAADDHRHIKYRRLSINMDTDMLQCDFYNGYMVTKSEYDVEWNVKPTEDAIEWLYMPDRLPQIKYNNVQIITSEKSTTFVFDGAHRTTVDEPITTYNKKILDECVYKYLDQTYTPMCRVNRKYLMTVLQNTNAKLIDIDMTDKGIMRLRDVSDDNISHLCCVKRLGKDDE